MNKTIIALTGYAGVGKDTFADFILKYGKEHNNPGTKIDLVEKLKVVASQLFDIPMIHFTDRQLKDSPLKNIRGIDNIPSMVLGKTPRYILQTLGSYICENIDKQYWIKYGCLKINQTYRNICIISGIRKNSEAEYLKEQFPKSFLLHLKRIEVGAINNHPTEFPIDSRRIDYEIQLPQLHTQEYVECVENTYKTLIGV